MPLLRDGVYIVIPLPLELHGLDLEPRGECRNLIAKVGGKRLRAAEELFQILKATGVSVNPTKQERGAHRL